MKPIVVEFNYDPDMPLESRHKGTPEKCLVFGQKEFKTFDEARKFLHECTCPITTDEQLDKMEWNAELKHLKNRVWKLEQQLRDAQEFGMEIVYIN